MPPNHLASGGRGRGGDSLGYLAWGSMIQNRGKQALCNLLPLGTKWGFGGGQPQARLLMGRSWWH